MTGAKPQSQRSSRFAFWERFEVPNFDNPEQTYLARLRIRATWVWYRLRRLALRPAPTGERCVSGFTVHPGLWCPRRATSRLWCARHCVRRHR